MPHQELHHQFHLSIQLSNIFHQQNLFSLKAEVCTPDEKEYIKYFLILSYIVKPPGSVIHLFTMINLPKISKVGYRSVVLQNELT